jgi:hypothetical protein
MTDHVLRCPRNPGRGRDRAPWNRRRSMRSALSSEIHSSWSAVYENVREKPDKQPAAVRRTEICGAPT